MSLSPTAPVAARTRSRRSVDAAQAQRSRIPEPARLRPVEEEEGPYMRGKRKSEGCGGRERKRHSGTHGQTPRSHPPTPGYCSPHTTRTPKHIATARNPNHTTPGRTPTRPPTPARLLLRSDPDDDAKMARVSPRPPTPPRLAIRTVAQGHLGLGLGTPKRPRSPRSPHDTFKAPRLVVGEHARPRQTSLTTFFTPQPSRPALTLPSTVAVERRIAPLPRPTPLALKHPNSRLPRPPTTPRFTVPVPFGGRVGDNTAASLLKSAKRPDGAPAPVAGDMDEAKCLAPAPRKTAIPLRRPSTRSTTAPARRQPSYPSSLGSGPTARPTNRAVSNPMVKPVITESMEVDEPSTSHPSVSEPTPGRTASAPTRPSARASEPVRPAVRPDMLPKRESLSMPSRREGYDDTARNLSALNAALANLRIPSRARETDTLRPRTRPPTPTVTSTPLPAVGSTPRPRNLSSRPPLAPEKGRLERLMNTESKLFRGVTAYVDVRNEDGADVGSSFIEMLRNGGARVLSRPTENCTHFIYKSGRPNTAAFWRRLDSERRPHVVGLRWVVNSLKAGRRESEAEHCVDFADEVVFQKRTKSMEPKALPLSKLRLVSIPEAPYRAYTPKVPSPLRPMYE
ncbi:hypothetical protein CcaverHIS631_0407640 [Cutaneotrichosporon cavernicola]|nr:hypothetical protein CcaverHIS631_0407640 [Cutaneotrichosporon cavernicola]